MADQVKLVLVTRHIGTARWVGGLWPPCTRQYSFAQLGDELIVRSRVRAVVPDRSPYRKDPQGR